MKSDLGTSPVIECLRNLRADELLDLNFCGQNIQFAAVQVILFGSNSFVGFYGGYSRAASKADLKGPGIIT